MLICTFLLFGTWCFFYQDDAISWLEARFSDKAAWEKDFGPESLSSIQSYTKNILSAAGVLSIAVSVINFACIYFGMKISMAFETIHTMIQVQTLVLICISYLIIYAGSIANGYYSIPQVSEAEPDFLPQVFIYTGLAMICVAYIGFFASKNESKIGLVGYILLCVFLLANFTIFTFLLNYGSTSLQSTFEDKCQEIMPFFHQTFFQNFGCNNKNIQTSNDLSLLSCPK
jgi:hypothetical protein